MKTLAILLAFTSISSSYIAQTIYSNTNAPTKVQDERTTVKFFKASSGVFNFGGATALSAAVDIGLGLFELAMEKRLKEYSGEYAITAKKTVDDTDPYYALNFLHEVEIGGKWESALEIRFSPVSVGTNYYYYTIDELTLDYSKAKRKKNAKVLDYSIQLQIVYLVNGEKKTQKLEPIVIEGISNKITVFNTNKYQTEYIIVPSNSKLIEASIKIVESNPKKVKIEKALKLFEDYKDVLKSFLTE